MSPLSENPAFTDHGSHRRDLLFLVVDDDPDGRFLIAKTLLRNFPRSSVLECQTAEAAFRHLEQHTVSLVILHRTFELDGISLIRELRKRAPDVPLLMTSGIDRRAAALQAGADAFLTYDEWLMVGKRVEQLLRPAEREAAVREAPGV